MAAETQAANQDLLSGNAKQSSSEDVLTRYLNFVVHLLATIGCPWLEVCNFVIYIANEC